VADRGGEINLATVQRRIRLLVDEDREFRVTLREVLAVRRQIETRRDLMRYTEIGRR
jgi:hypothetical protein